MVLLDLKLNAEKPIHPSERVGVRRNEVEVKEEEERPGINR